MRFSLATAAAVTAALAGSAAGMSATPPRLLIDQTTPVIVRGSHFHAGEHVRVTAYVVGATATRNVIATRRGTFAVRFAGLKATSCGAYGARAVGSRGSRAAFRFLPPECAPGPAP